MARDTEEFETSIFRDRKAGRFFYIHESGLVFTAMTREIADTIENEQPHVVSLVAGMPRAAKPYTPNDDSPEGRAIGEWIDAMDSVAIAIGRLAEAARSSAKTAKKLQRGKLRAA